MLLWGEGVCGDWQLFAISCQAADGWSGRGKRRQSDMMVGGIFVIFLSAPIGMGFGCQITVGQAKQKHVCLRCPLESTRLVLRYCMQPSLSIRQPCKSSKCFSFFVGPRSVFVAKV